MDCKRGVIADTLSTKIKKLRRGEMTVSIWLEDADAIKIGDDIKSMLFLNVRIKDYLSSNRILGIAGTKGQGKTFLIKTKRNFFQKLRNYENDSSITCFPKDNMVDTLDSAIRPHRSIRKKLDDYDVWVSLWKYSIAMTIIKSPECKNLFTDDSDERENRHFKSLSKISKFILSSVDNHNCRPTVILNKLLEKDISDLKIVLSDVSHLLQLLNYIKSAFYIFIDKIDQAFFNEVFKTGGRGKNESFWQYCQYALANASYDIFSNINSHIKVFYTIRHEALLDSHHMARNTCRNIEAYIMELKYSKQDLFEMFKIYVNNESDDNLFDAGLKQADEEKAFIGVSKIQHSYMKDVEEALFDYIYRHSLRRPYDIMKLCNELYLHGVKNLDIQNIKRIINDVAVKILQQYFSEIGPFIACTKNDIDNLLGSINTNAFDMNYMQFVCERFNSEFGNISSCKKDCINCSFIHPFSALYNIGLLGYVESTPANPELIQSFLPIGESKLKVNEHNIKASELYFLHPSLCDLARNIREKRNKAFQSSQKTIFGDEITINHDVIDAIKMNLQKLTDELNNEKIFISSTIEDLGSERLALRKLLFTMGMYPILSESDEFPYGEVDSHDHCIDEMLKCKNLIFIIGKEYGGEYGGSKYKDYVDIIKEQSKGKIVNPSISLMEYFVAKNNKIDCKVLILKEISNVKKAREEYPNVDDKVFAMINFINHRRKDDGNRSNWFVPFSDEEELVRKVKNIGFD